MCQLRSHMGQTCLEASLPEEEGGGVFQECASPVSLPCPCLPSAHWTTEGPSLEKGRCSGRGRPIPEEQGRGGGEQRVSWPLRELSFSTPGTGSTHGLSEPWPQPALDGQSQASAHADPNRGPAPAFLVCARSYWRSLIIQPCLTPTQRDVLLLPCASHLRFLWPSGSAWVFLRTLG